MDVTHAVAAAERSMRDASRALADALRTRNAQMRAQLRNDLEELRTTPTDGMRIRMRMAHLTTMMHVADVEIAAEDARLTLMARAL